MEVNEEFKSRMLKAADALEDNDLPLAALEIRKAMKALEPA